MMRLVMVRICGEIVLRLMTVMREALPSAEVERRRIVVVVMLEDVENPMPLVSIRSSP